MSKVIKAVFTGRFCTCRRVFQWDTDDKLQLVNLDLPQNYTVDFANSVTGTSVPVLASSDTVQIPPEMFVPGSEIYAWVWVSDTNGGHTKCQATIPIDPRAQRSGTSPAPAQASAWDQAVQTLNDAAADYETAASHAPIIQNGYWFIWDSTAGEYVTTDVKAVGIDGQDGYSPTASVTKVGNTATITITDQNGTTTATVTDGEDGTDGNNVWTVEAQYCQNVGASVKMQISHMIGRAGASVSVGDIVFISDGRFCSVTLIVGIGALASVIGDLHGPAGYSPEVTITEITGGHRVTITDEEHPSGQSFDVMDGTGGGGISPYTSNPAPLGTASPGSSDDYARGDHVHENNLFVCVYGTTTNSEINTALNAGKAVVVPHAGYIYYLSTIVSSTRHIFGAAGDGTTHCVVCDNGSWSVQAYTIPTGSDTTPQALGTAAAGSSTDYSRADHVHAKPTYSKSDVGLGNVDNVQQYSSSNPPPYPVSSVNGQTGAVSLPIPSTASEVGAVAVAQGVEHAGEFVIVGSDGNITSVAMSVWQGGSY